MQSAGEANRWQMPPGLAIGLQEKGVRGGTIGGWPIAARVTWRLAMAGLAARRAERGAGWITRKRSMAGDKSLASQTDPSAGRPTMNQKEPDRSPRWVAIDASVHEQESFSTNDPGLLMALIDATAGNL